MMLTITKASTCGDSPAVRDHIALRVAEGNRRSMTGEAWRY
jgi:hypothetical protein